MMCKVGLITALNWEARTWVCCHADSETPHLQLLRKKMLSKESTTFFCMFPSTLFVNDLLVYNSDGVKNLVLFDTEGKVRSFTLPSWLIALHIAATGRKPITTEMCMTTSAWKGTLRKAVPPVPRSYDSSFASGTDSSLIQSPYFVESNDRYFPPTCTLEPVQVVSERPF